MAYCVQADVERAAGGEAELIRLTDQAGSGQIDSTVLAEAIAEADAWINGYVAKQRAVPLDPVPDLIRKLSAAEAVYRLKGDSTTDRDEAQHMSREQYLRDIARGIVTLGVDPQPAKSALVSPAVLINEDDDREITAESTEGLW